MNDSIKIKKDLSDLFSSQKLAVLSTNNDGESYASLVAFITNDDIKEICFVTARNTRKFSNLMSNPQVALLIDSRSNQEADFDKAIAATAIGIAEEIEKLQKDQIILETKLNEDGEESFQYKNQTFKIKIDEVKWDPIGSDYIKIRILKIGE